MSHLSHGVGHPESDRTSAVCRRNIRVVTLFYCKIERHDGVLLLIKISDISNSECFSGDQPLEDQNEFVANMPDNNNLLQLQIIFESPLLDADRPDMPSAIPKGITEHG